MDCKRNNIKVRKVRNYIKYTLCDVRILEAYLDPIYGGCIGGRVIICRVLGRTNRRTTLYYRGIRSGYGYRGNHFCVTFTNSVWQSGHKFILF
jgi:hypothetical protein